MNPISLYQADLLKPTFFSDPAQLQAITMLQRLFDELLEKQMKAIRPKSILKRLVDFNKPHRQIKGLYFYGGVGRGKTYLVDLFYLSIKSERKRRLHFHHFMLYVHRQLALLQGRVNPLKHIAKQLADDIDILCLDELFVEDITDAMILAGIFEALFSENVILVATSNIYPDDLYKNGLQRARFLPAIDLIKQHCDVFNLHGSKDYRLGRFRDTQTYHYPLTAVVLQKMQDIFAQVAMEDQTNTHIIEINHRPLTIITASRDMLCIEFTELCGGPRSVSDYIELAIIYRVLVVVNVPQMQDQQNDLVRRFITMVDELYDQNVRLIIFAEVKVEHLYKGMKLTFQFQRCISRLLEMQSKAYLCKVLHSDS